MSRLILLAVTLLALAGCTFRPVYQDHDPRSQMSLAFDLEKPTSRLEQIVYEDIALRFYVTKAPNTPKLRVSVATSGGAAFLSDTFIKKSDGQRGAPSGLPRRNQITATATATATYQGKTTFTATRNATAEYTSSGQIIADQAALVDAQERAAKSAAESLRLAILATFPKHVNGAN